MFSIDFYINEMICYVDFILLFIVLLEYDYYDIIFNVFVVCNVICFNEVVLLCFEGVLYDWEIFVGLVWVFVVCNGLELKLILELQQMIDFGLCVGVYGDCFEYRLSLVILCEYFYGIDFGLLWLNLVLCLKIVDQCIQVVLLLFVDDL